MGASGPSEGAELGFQSGYGKKLRGCTLGAGRLDPEKPCAIWTTVAASAAVVMLLWLASACSVSSMRTSNQRMVLIGVRRKRSGVKSPPIADVRTR